VHRVFVLRLLHNTLDPTRNGLGSPLSACAEVVPTCSRVARVLLIAATGGGLYMVLCSLQSSHSCSYVCAARGNNGITFDQLLMWCKGIFYGMVFIMFPSSTCVHTAVQSYRNTRIWSETGGAFFGCTLTTISGFSCLTPQKCGWWHKTCA
jgi:hypothetical protein